MKRTLLLTFIFVVGICLHTDTWAQSNINLTPVPKQMTVNAGELSLPQKFTIATGTFDEACANEARKFASHLVDVTGYSIEVKENDEDALIKYITSSTVTNDEGYTLQITADGIAISAISPRGFYYAFQTIKKLLPPCVMAGVRDEAVTTFNLPLVKINDAPRFEYRGFMLDVARHYFEVKEIKRMIDVMSYYKMNRFHWHLVDDQGWRIEIEKYPKLTTIGATRNNSWSVDPIYGGYYTNEPYGPYFYTKEEAREIVEYAKERHIEVIPEIEFPGHACAALTAYPEFSCSPNGSHSVKVDGGIYADVFNVASPATLQFAKDVIDEIIDIFPYNQIHIGGDECPTSAWSSNEECLALMEQEGFDHIRELQSRFVRLLSDYAASKEGDKKRSVIMWNESLSAAGSNIELIKGTGGTMMCWEQGKVQSTALQAAKLGMKSVITPWGPYYINRKQSTQPGEPVGAGNGADDVRATYNYLPVPADVPTSLQKYYCGVQGTFWTEHVQSNYLLEYLALPRLIAIAETGWSPASKKNFEDFCRRITADSVLLNYNNYEYGRHFMIKESEGGEEKVMPVSSTDEEKHWYRIITGATDATRSGRCIELLREGAPIIGTGNAQADRLWNGIVAQEGEEAYDYQLWAFMEDPANPGHYALVSKAKPEGSVNSTPTSGNNTARWDYDDNKRHYDFIFGEAIYSKNGNYYRYSIHSTKAAAGMYMNMAGAGQNYSINMWSDPNDGNGGVWEFRPLDEAMEEPKIEYPTEGSFVRIENSVEQFAEWRLYDDGKSTLTADTAKYTADVWEVTSATTTADGQEVTLRNRATGRYISGTTSPIALGNTPATLKNVYNDRTGDFSIMAGNGAIFPMPHRATANAHTLNVGGIYPQGSAWRYQPVYQITYECYDDQGNPIGTYYSSQAQGKPFTAAAPAIKNMSIKGYGDDADKEAPSYETLDEHKSIKVIYERNAYSIILRCIEERGGIISSEEISCPINKQHTLALPTIPYYTLTDNTADGSTITLTRDTVIVVTYSTEGICGFKAVGNQADKVEAGRSYLFFNNKDDNSRNGFIYANATGSNIITDNSASSGSPAYVWHTEASGNHIKVYNELGCYIPTLTKGSANKASDKGGSFIFQPNNNGTFNVKCSNGLYWNANSDHTFTGWSEGHPIIAYEYLIQPYFAVTISCIDEDGNTLQTSSQYLPAGDTFTLNTPTFDGLTPHKVEGATNGVNIVEGNMNIVISYKNNNTAVEAIGDKKQNAGPTYNLKGETVVKPTQRGIYINNGKKILVK